MSAKDGHEKQADARARVYKYTGQDGTVYYSFARKPKIITPSQTLVLESRLGTHLENFLPKFRQESRGHVRTRGDESSD